MSEAKEGTGPLVSELLSALERWWRAETTLRETSPRQEGWTAAAREHEDASGCLVAACEAVEMAAPGCLSGGLWS